MTDPTSPEASGVEGHTPGPWHVGEGIGARIVYDAAGWPICDAKIHHARLSRTAMQANARLIAAAPALLEAFKPFVDLGPQRGAWGVISKALDGLAPLTVTITKSQMLAAIAAIELATKS